MYDDGMPNTRGLSKTVELDTKQVRYPIPSVMVWLRLKVSKWVAWKRILGPCRPCRLLCDRILLQFFFFFGFTSSWLRSRPC